VGPQAAGQDPVPTFDLFIGDTLGPFSNPNRFNHDIAVLSVQNTFIVTNAIIKNTTGFVAALRVHSFDHHANAANPFNISIRPYRDLGDSEGTDGTPEAAPGVEEVSEVR